MDKVKIYIAASWKHQHSVQMMTQLLRQEDFEVISFVEDGLSRHFMNTPFDEWVLTHDAKDAFHHDMNGALFCDIFIYIGPSGKDAAAECGAAWAKGRALMIGLLAKGEDFGLTRLMFHHWLVHYEDVIGKCIKFRIEKQFPLQ